jgi:hypothetical protein
MHVVVLRSSRQRAAWFLWHAPAPRARLRRPFGKGWPHPRGLQRAPEREAAVAVQPFAIVSVRVDGARNRPACPVEAPALDLPSPLAALRLQLFRRVGV